MIIAIDARMYGNEQCTGIGTYIENMTKALFEIDQKNEYILFLREPAYSKFIPPNNRVRKALVKSHWYTAREQFVLPFEMMKEKFDLIHYPHFNSPILYPKKSICTIHDITPLSYPGHKMGSLIRRLGYQAVFRATLLKASKIIAVSEATKAGIVDYFHINPTKIKVTHEGVDERFQSIANSDIINQVKVRFGITKPFIFFIGVWREHKNIEGLIKAFNLLKEKYKIEHQLVLGGREDLHYTGVRKLINESPHKQDIVTTGYIDDTDLPVLYSSASCFALPSFIEGFGLIAIEAEKCGCPVISSNTSSLPEVLGQSAEYFNPHNIEEMAEKINLVLTDAELRERMVEAGYRNCNRFSWENCARETLEIYETTN